MARSPSGKAEVCKTFIPGSIPGRASIFLMRLFLIIFWSLSFRLCVAEAIADGYLDERGIDDGLCRN